MRGETVLQRKVARILLVAACLAALVLPFNAAHAATCGGPWTGPMGTNCSYTSTTATVNFGGIAFGASAAVGVTVFSPPGVFAGGCTNTGAGVAACTGSVAIGVGQVVICEVKGLNGGVYGCSD